MRKPEIYKNKTRSKKIDTVRRGRLVGRSLFKEKKKANVEQNRKQLSKIITGKTDKHKIIVKKLSKSHNEDVLKELKLTTILENVRKESTPENLDRIARALIDNPSFDPDAFKFVFEQSTQTDKSKNTVKPTTPPGGQYYNERPEINGRKENVEDFILRVYGEAGWLDDDFERTYGLPFGRPDLKRCDPKAEKALQNWIYNHGQSEELNLPTKSELLDAEVEETKLSTSMTQGEYNRIISARKRRALTSS